MGTSHEDLCKFMIVLPNSSQNKKCFRWNL